MTPDTHGSTERGSAPATAAGQRVVKLTRRAFIHPSTTSAVELRGVTWVTDGYVLVRADVLRTIPKPWDGPPIASAKAVRQLLATAKGEGVALRSGGLIEHKPLEGPTGLQLLQGRGRFVALNKDVADEWLRYGWHSITQDRQPFVEFRQWRGGRPVLAGLVMPVHLSGVIRQLDAASCPDVPQHRRHRRRR